MLTSSRLCTLLQCSPRHPLTAVQSFLPMGPTCARLEILSWVTFLSTFVIGVMRKTSRPPRRAQIRALSSTVKEMRLVTDLALRNIGRRHSWMKLYLHQLHWCLLLDKMTQMHS